ncbi:hypothetical protein ACFL1L_01180 [Thermoplasmatota archaeon]
MNKIIIGLVVCLIVFYSFNVISVDELKKTTGLNFNSGLIELDCNNINGNINHYGDINCGPVPNHNTIDGVDITVQYMDSGLDFIRTHDFNGPTDISEIFPDFSQDPYLESSYNFNLSDKYITGIINAGCKVFYRLGESASTNESMRQPPADFDKWSEICQHVIMHYNDGWANGFFYNITYWEIWNEPDLMGFWNGTSTEYYALYNKISQKIKTYDPSLKVGGPCTSSIDNINYTIGYLNYIKSNQLPLDFFSWHMYADSPNQLYKASLKIRSMLDEFGFYETENINTEWNYNILTPQRDKDNSKNAAFTACTLSSFQDAEIDYAFRYRGTQDNNWLMRFIGFDLSLFTYDGKYKTPALSYKSLYYISKDTPNRFVTPKINSSDGFTYLAGISDDKSNISILISNFEGGEIEYSMVINNLPWNSSYNIVYYLIDDTTHLEIIENKESDINNVNITKIIKSSSIHFLRLTNSSIIPKEGPPTASIPWFLQLKLFDPISKIMGILLMLLFFT